MGLSHWFELNKHLLVSAESKIFPLVYGKSRTMISLIYHRTLEHAREPVYIFGQLFIFLHWCLLNGSSNSTLRHLALADTPHYSRQQQIYRKPLPTPGFIVIARKTKTRTYESRMLARNTRRKRVIFLNYSSGNAGKEEIERTTPGHGKAV